MTTTADPAPDLAAALPDRHAVRFHAAPGEQTQVTIDGRDVAHHLSGIQIVSDRLAGARVALEVPPHRLDAVEFEGIAVVTIDQYADDPGPAAAVFLSAIDPAELERAALNRLDVGAEENATTTAILRQLIEWANGEGDDMTAGLDFSGLKRVVDGWLTDADVVVARDFGTGDAELDPETGQLIEPEPHAIYVGNGVVQALSGYTNLPEIQRILEHTEARWRLLLPLGVAQGEPKPGDKVWVTQVRAAVIDGRLLNSIYRVVDVGGESVWGVVRIYYLELDRHVDDTPALPPPWPGAAAVQIAGILDEGDVPPEGVPDGTIYLIQDQP